MLESLKSNSAEAHVFVLCMDEITFEILGELNYGFVTRLKLENVEDESLLVVKPTRGVAEYCWTLTPCLPWYIFHNYKYIQQLTYLDADLLFFSPVDSLFDEIGERSIAVIEHRFIPRLRDSVINGRFNVEWVTFRRDEQGMACLSKWRDQCIEWCFNRLEDGRMGDQKYLDEWPDRYSSLCIIENIGAGVGPWNYANYEIKRVDGKILVDDTPLVFYHYHQFQMFSFKRFDYVSSMYVKEKPLPRDIYKSYEDALLCAMRKVQKVRPDFNFGIKPFFPVFIRRVAQKYLPRGVKTTLKKYIRT